MRVFWGVLFIHLFCTGKGFSKEKINTLILKKIPSQGILLNQGWKYKVGDNPIWADPNFDDRDWKSINPTLDVHIAQPQISQTGIGWFRLTLSLDSSILKRELALVIQQSGACEIFLNGIKIKSYGRIGSRPAQVWAADPYWKPLSIHFNRSKVQVLALRYALQPGIQYTKIFETENPAFSIQLMDFEKAIDYFHIHASNILGLFIGLTGMCIMIIILHLSFFILYPGQKANLYFAFWAIGYGIGSIVQLIYYQHVDGVANKYYMGNIAFAIIIIGEVFLMLSAHLFLQRKRDFIFYSLVLFSGIAIFLNTWLYGFGWRIGGAIFMLLVQINILRIAILSTLKNQRGAWIITVGAVSTIVFFGVFISQGTFTNPSYVLSLSPLRMFTYTMQIISLPIASSVFLAFEFAFANGSLKQKLIEVNHLSQQNLAQEKEKQQLLALQNETLEKQVKKRTEELNQSLLNLKSTQSQLIQSEKMASLGALTAGIAHEIQNPLNFVNNFAEVNAELISELEQEAELGKLEEVILIIKEIRDNEQKINHHGKRANAIVKGMLQYSVNSFGIRKSTNINSLTDEYLRLAYHEFCSKDSSFHVSLKKDFDESTGTLDIVIQDIGRVILNVFINAFYAVNQRKAKTQEGYEPLVSVSTRLMDGKIEIKVRDNGNGIPQNLMDKIFQPFFTTKPTGQGTGLGLSLSYEIIKAHGGELKVNSKEGEFTEFGIFLPV